MATGETLTSRERQAIDKAARRATVETGLTFTVVFLDAGPEPRARARQLHADLADPAHAVLLLVDPAARALEIVTGVEANRRIGEREATLASLAMTSKFSIGDLAGGVVDGLQFLAEHGRRPPTLHHSRG